MSGIVATLLVIFGMVVVGEAGYALGRYVLASKLQPSEVHDSRPTPIRILTPDEARAVAHDEASPVWTEGVKDSDIPKVEPAPGTDRPRRHTKPTQSTPATTTPSQPAPTTDTTPPPSDSTEPAPTTTDTGDTTSTTPDAIPND